MVALRRTYQSNQGSRTAKDGLRLWFRASVASAVVAALAMIALFVWGLKLEWLADRYSGILAPIGAIVAAAIASAGGARLAMAQTVNADRTRAEDAEKELWARFAGAAKQLADDSHFMVRVAGVYAFVGLADDWLRHHKRREEVGSPALSSKAECETITDTLCAYLRQNTHKQGQDQDPPTGQAGERVVNEAIIGQLWIHLALEGSDSGDASIAKGSWAGLGLVLDLRGVDLERSHFSRMDLSKAVLKHADLFDADLKESRLEGADLRGAELSKADLRGVKCDGTTNFEDVTYNSETKWPDGFTPPASAVLRPDTWRHPTEHETTTTAEDSVQAG